MCIPRENDRILEKDYLQFMLLNMCVCVCVCVHIFFSNRKPIFQVMNVSIVQNI